MDTPVSTPASKPDAIPSATEPTMFLREGESRRVRRGHPWVFSNEVDTKRSPFAGFNAGETVKLRDGDGSDGFRRTRWRYRVRVVHV